MTSLPRRVRVVGFWEASHIRHMTMNTLSLD
jgi:hypothetical protein